MLWKLIFPVIVIAGSNTIYNICQKQTPENANTFMALFITYVVAAIASLALFFLSPGKETVASEIKKLNWASYLLGFSIIGLEAGYILLFRAGWKISAGSLVCNIVLAVVLLLVGVLFYKESVSVKQLTGILLCMAGLYLITK